MKPWPIIVCFLLILPHLPAGSANSIENMLYMVTEELLKGYLTQIVDFGVRYTGSEECRMAEEWIYREFKSMGLWTRYQEWKMGGFQDRNVIATLNGTDNYTVIIGAHVDTVKNAPGADDNGSGVAAVLAIARILSQYEFVHTVRFIIYTGEEVGTYGSYNYARQAYMNGERILAVLNPDMIGYADSAKGGNTIRFFESERAKWLTDFSINVSRKYHDIIKLDIERVPNYPGSDHQAYLDYGYDAVFIAHWDGYKYGHSPEDTLDKINFTYHVKATRLLLAILAELSEKRISTYVRIVEPMEGYLYVLNRPIMPIVSPQWYFDLRGKTILIGKTDIIVEVDGNVDKVIFAIDDNMKYWDYSPPYQWKLNAYLLWKHDIKVYAYGEELAKDEMDVIAFVTYGVGMENEYYEKTDGYSKKIVNGNHKLYNIFHIKRW